MSDGQGLARGCRVALCLALILSRLRAKACILNITSGSWRVTICSTFFSPGFCSQARILITFLLCTPPVYSPCPQIGEELNKLIFELERVAQVGPSCSALAKGQGCSKVSLSTCAVTVIAFVKSCALACKSSACCCATCCNQSRAFPQNQVVGPLRSHMRRLDDVPLCVCTAGLLFAGQGEAQHGHPEPDLQRGAHQRDPDAHLQGGL